MMNNDFDMSVRITIVVHDVSTGKADLILAIFTTTFHLTGIVISIFRTIFLKQFK